MKKCIIGAVMMLVGMSAFFSYAVTTNAYCNPAALGMTVFGQQSQTVSALQGCLIAAGYAIPAGATGFYGEQTRTAVKLFYLEALNVTDWDGNSVGPLGRSTLGTLAAAPVTGGGVPVVAGAGYKAVGSAAELKKYINAESEGTIMARTMSTGLDSEQSLSAPSVMADGNSGKSNTTPDRVSGTNVQITGIDEPDIVKTDGQNIFVSRESRWYGFMDSMPRIMSDDMMMPVSQPNPTVVVDAYPLEDLKVVSEAIPETGEMLLVKDTQTLVIFSQPKIVAYNVKNPQKPEKIWEKTIGDDSSIITSRLLDGTIYVVTGTYLHVDRPCPIMPLRSGNQSLTISCGAIMVPERIEPTSHVYTVMKINPTTGTVTAEKAIAGNYGGVTVMMSTDNIYVASKAESSRWPIMSELTIESATPYVPASVIAQAKKILTYDISDYGAFTEISNVLSEYLYSVEADERARIETEMSNQLVASMKKRIREMVQSRVVRIDLDTLTVEATGMVPGYLLNQFAMDEHMGNLRMAMTVDDGWGGAESVNDVYVLTPDLKIVGAVRDLGLDERIYSVRFMGDTAYLVTFRQTDPFYVLDLRTPTAPKVVGELKIPGYSAYLEYLGDDLVLGVGREGSGVKMSIFDVSNPAKPVEKSKYQITDAWSEVENNHHAFLRDEKHQVFFIPGGEGGYIFSYKNGTIELKKVLSGYGVKRALYIDDYLYVVSDDKIRVLNEKTWLEEKSIDL